MLLRLGQLILLTTLLPILAACHIFSSDKDTVVAYFDKNGNTVSQAVAGGSYRKILNKRTNGLLVQNFFNDTHSQQTDPFIIDNNEDLSVFMPSNIDGTYTRWYANGKKAEVGHYQHGLKEGQFTEWNTQGNTLMEMTFVNNLPHGKATLWYSKGTKYIEGQYSYGAETGTWYIRYPTGEIKLIINFSAGKLISAEDTNGHQLNLDQLKKFTIQQPN